jgi:large subunit ribosomal protein L23
MTKFMALKPRVSEKSYGLSQLRNTYVFDVPGDANKLTVAQAVQAQFEVTVETVNITNLKGKIKRSYRKGSRPGSGKRVDIKKAYVRLKAGESIPVFASLEEETPKEAKADKKAAAKKEIK